MLRVPYAPGLSHGGMALQGSFSWQPCTVLDFDTATERFVVHWGRGGEQGQQKQVSRLNLLFAHESRSAFRLRLQQARARRAEAEAAIDFERYVASQPVLDQPLNGNVLRARLLRQLPHARASTGVDGLLQEVQRNYARAMQRDALLRASATVAGRAALASAGVRIQSARGSHAHASANAMTLPLLAGFNLTCIR